ncbi:hypothetical protein GN956_G10968 [Arapaima gigas]
MRACATRTLGASPGRTERAGAARGGDMRGGSVALAVWTPVRCFSLQRAVTGVPGVCQTCPEHSRCLFLGDGTTECCAVLRAIVLQSTAGGPTIAESGCNAAAQLWQRSVAVSEVRAQAVHGLMAPE